MPLAQSQMWWPGINRQDSLARRLKAHYPIWEGAGSTIMDLANPDPKALLGTLDGATWVGSSDGWALSHDGNDDCTLLDEPDEGTFRFPSRFSVVVDLAPVAGSIAQFDVAVSCVVQAGRGWRLWTRDAANFKWYWEVYDGAAKNTVSTGVITSARQQIICVHDGTTLRLYIDGRANGTPTAAGTVSYTRAADKTRTLIAAMPSDEAATVFQRFFPAVYNYVAIYDGILTPFQIQQLYLDRHALTRLESRAAVRAPSAPAAGHPTMSRWLNVPHMHNYLRSAG